MATYVLIHGAGHGGWCWKRVAIRLQAQGHLVYAPTLTGLGDRSHLLSDAVDLGMHIADVVNVLEFEDATNVILVGHSYGGAVITGAADRELPRIGQLVFLDAAQPRDGESAFDLSSDFRRFIEAGVRTVDGIDLALWPDSPEVTALYGVTDPGDLAWMQPRLRPHPLKTFAQKLRLSNSSAVFAIPRTNINCTPTLQQSDAGSRARALDADRVWEIDCGHDAMIVKPAEIAEMLLKLASD